MADIRITDLVDEKVFEELEKLSEDIRSVKQQYLDAARELAQGLNMKISTSGDIEKFNKAVAESSRKAQDATDHLNASIERQRTIIGQTTNVISRELAEIEKENKEKRAAFEQDKSAMDIAERLIGNRRNNIVTLVRLQGELKKVTEAQKELDTHVKSGILSGQEAASKRTRLIEQQRELKAAIKDVNLVLTNQEKQMQATDGSYQKLSLQLEFLKKAYKGLNEEEKNSDMGKTLNAEIQNLDAHLKDLAADMGEFQRNTGNYAIVGQTAKKELSDLISYIAQLTIQYRGMTKEEKESAKGKELETKIETLTQKAGNFKDVLQDVKQSINADANDTKNFSAITEGINLLISGVGGLTAASHALGIGEKDLLKIQTTLQASLAASNALTKAQSSLQAESNLMKGVARLQEAAHAAAIWVKNKAEGEGIIITKAATVAQATFNKVAAMNPYVLLATGIGLLVSAVLIFTKATKGETEEQKKAREEMEKSKREYEEFIDVEKRLAEAREKGIESCSDEIAKLDILYSAAIDVTRSYKERKLAVDKLRETYPEYLGKLQEEAIMTGKAADAVERLKSGIIGKAIAQAQEKQIQKYAEAYAESMEKMTIASEQLEKVMENLGFSTQKMLDKNGKEIKVYAKTVETEMDKIYRDRPEDMRKMGDFNMREKERLEGIIAEAKKNQEDFQKAMERVKGIINIENLLDNIVGSKNPTKPTKETKEVTTKTYEEIKEVILEYTQQIISERIALTQEGSKEEYDLTLQYIKAEQELREIEITKGYTKEKKALDEALTNKTVTQEQYNTSILELEETRNSQSILAEQKANRAREDARKKYTEAVITSMQETYTKEQDERTLNLMQETTALTRQRTEKIISEEEYQKQVAELQQRYAQETADKQIEMLEKVLQNEQLTADQRKSIAEELKAAKIKAANDAANAELKNLKETEKKDAESARKREKTAKQYIQTVSKMIGQLNSLVSAIYDGRLQKIDEEKEASEKAYDKEIEQIENLEETGAISKEESEARKRAAEQRSAEKQEELERKKQELLYRQAVWEKATSIAQAGIATALAITEALPNIVLAALVGAMGAMEVATIIATPIATYSKGTGKDPHPGGFAIVGDAGKREAVVFDSKMWISPDTPTLVDMPKGAVVYPDADKIPAPVFMTVAPASDNDSKPTIIVSHDSKKLERIVSQTNTLIKQSMVMQKRIAYDAAYQEYKRRRL